MKHLIILYSARTRFLDLLPRRFRNFRSRETRNASSKFDQLSSNYFCSMLNILKKNQKKTEKSSNSQKCSFQHKFNLFKNLKTL